MTRRAPPEEPEDDDTPLFPGALPGVTLKGERARLRLHGQDIDRYAVRPALMPIYDGIPPPSTFRDRLAEHFRAHPGEWIGGLELAKIAGAYAWRSRVSDCRTQLGMRIDNRQRKERDLTISEYRYTSSNPAGPNGPEGTR